MIEPCIVVNGKILTEGQAMSVRVAITSFLMDMTKKGALGTDEHGEAMREAYKARLSEVVAFINPVDSRSAKEKR